MNNPQSNPDGTSLDRVRLIRRSMRCGVFGALGAVPVFGLPLGWVAMRLYRQVGEEAGDRWNLRTLNACWAAGLLALAGLVFLEWWALAGLFSLLLMGTHFLVLAMLARRVQAREWNPARRWVYWGVGLAYSGRATSAALLVSAVSLLARKLIGDSF